MGKTFFIIGAVILIGIISFLFWNAGAWAGGFETIENFEGDIQIYKSSTCGCCGLYGGYFQRNGNSNAEITNMMSVDSIKEEYGVPGALTSCHTTIIGDYFVEGHIPLEAIEKLLLEQPDIAGIAMPGMPSGSPGMPGAKFGDFIIYAVAKDGTYEEFMRI